MAKILETAVTWSWNLSIAWKNFMVNFLLNFSTAIRSHIFRTVPVFFAVFETYNRTLITSLNGYIDGKLDDLICKKMRWADLSQRTSCFSRNVSSKVVHYDTWDVRERKYAHGGISLFIQSFEHVGNIFDNICTRISLKTL